MFWTFLNRTPPLCLLVGIVLPLAGCGISGETRIAVTPIDTNWEFVVLVSESESGPSQVPQVRHGEGRGPLWIFPDPYLDYSSGFPDPHLGNEVTFVESVRAIESGRYGVLVRTNLREWSLYWVAPRWISNERVTNDADLAIHIPNDAIPILVTDEFLKKVGMKYGLARPDVGRCEPREGSWDLSLGAACPKFRHSLEAAEAALSNGDLKSTFRACSRLAAEVDRCVVLHAWPDGKAVELEGIYIEFDRLRGAVLLSDAAAAATAFAAIARHVEKFCGNH